MGAVTAPVALFRSCYSPKRCFGELLYFCANRQCASDANSYAEGRPHGAARHT